MPDLLFIGVVLGFFAVAVGLVRACDRIIGPDPSVPPATPAPQRVDRSAEGDATSTEVMA